MDRDDRQSENRDGERLLAELKALFQRVDAVPDAVADAARAAFAERPGLPPR